MIFISFAGEDADLARALGLQMRAAGADVWCSVFKDDLDDGHPWSDQIYAALDRCDIFVLLVTGAPIDGMTKEESDYARDLYNKHKRPRVVSVRLDESAALPKRYESLQSVVLPSDWQAASSAFIGKKLRQWGELAESIAPSELAPPQSVPVREPRRPTGSWPMRVALLATSVAVVWGAAELYSRTGAAPKEASDERSQLPQPVGVDSAPRVERGTTGSTSAVLQMVRIPAGKFLMGDADSKEHDERPQHEVTVGAFELARTEVTRSQWREVMQADPPESEWRADRSDGQLPATKISWDEAREFCAKLSDRERLEGRSRYRLPSEAEWEYACRAGTTTAYCSGDGVTALDRVGWYDDNCGARVHAVGEKPANRWGLLDMHGNVWEWTEDGWHDTYEDAPDNGSAWVDEAVQGRAIRGGGYANSAEHARSANRGMHERYERWDGVGFRPARSVTTD